MTDKPRVRFAPSPTGHLHIGGARTAIYNWAFARKSGGTFVLRIDDTDPGRSTQENTDAILRAMKWLGLDWDEGPEIGGAFGPYFQTQRTSNYQAALEKMKANKTVYPCFCKAEDIAAKREAAQKTSGYAGYDRTCRDISTEEAAARIAAGEPHCWRLKVPADHADIEFDDAVRGHCHFPLEVMDDFVVVRTDGTPTYNFATVVDDAEMDITHIIRGDDHLSNTPRQILVYEALNAQLPVFAHLSMIWGPDGKRLSKRHGATSVEEYREQGYLPDTLINYLALLGWSLDGETTKFDKQTLCDNFSLEHISKNPAIFDNEKLDWLNGVYIREFSEDEFLDFLGEELIKSGLATQEDIDDNTDWYKAIRPLIFERIKHAPEIAPMISYLFGETVELDEKSVEKVLAKEGSKRCLDALIACLADKELVWNHESLEAAMRTLPEALEVKPKVVFQVARVALCGNMVSPPLFESVELLGRERCLSRLEAAKPFAL